MPVTSSVECHRIRCLPREHNPGTSDGDSDLPVHGHQVSTRAWGQQGRAMSAGSARHDAIIAEAAAPNRVHVFKTVGDGYCCASLEREASIATEL